MAPPVFSIDTIVHFLTKHILTPFPFLLLALAYGATSTAPLSFFTSDTIQIPIPSALPVLGTLSALFLLLQLLARLDSRIANGSRRVFEWEDQVVLVTGGLGGLGGLIAEMYGMRGVAVAAVDVKDITEKQEQELEEKGIRYWRCDVGDTEDVERMVRDVQEELGHPTILINNAATVSGGPFLATSPSQTARAFSTNTLGPLHLTRLLLPHMLSVPTGGHIVTVSSVLGYTGCAGLSLYTSTKAALLAFHNSLSAELALLASTPSATASAAGGSGPSYPASVRTTLVTPGQLRTPLFASVTPPSEFLGPLVEVKDLAVTIAEKIDRGEGGEVATPFSAGWIGVMRVLPGGLARVVRGLAGMELAGWFAYGGAAR